MATVQTYTKSEAIKQAKKSRATGWPKAHIERIEEGWSEGRYIIVMHGLRCTCGMCPMVFQDGFVK